MAEAELQALLETQRNENRNLREENERLNAMLSNLMSTMHQPRDERRQQPETMEMEMCTSLISLFWNLELTILSVPVICLQVDGVPSPSEDGASLGLCMGFVLLGLHVLRHHFSSSYAKGNSKDPYTLENSMLEGGRPDATLWFDL
ncbi:hypothetical protein POUND7_004290 [Theobroma cacao]